MSHTSFVKVTFIIAPKRPSMERNEYETKGQAGWMTGGKAEGLKTARLESTYLESSRARIAFACDPKRKRRAAVRLRRPVNAKR